MARALEPCSKLACKERTFRQSWPELGLQLYGPLRREGALAARLFALKLRAGRSGGTLAGAQAASMSEGLASLKS